MVMVRKQLYLSAEQHQKLRRIAAHRGCTEAEVVREAIERLPEYNDPITQRLAEAGVLAPLPDDEDLMSKEETDQLERELDGWLEGETEPFGAGLPQPGRQRQHHRRRPADSLQPSYLASIS